MKQKDNGWKNHFKALKQLSSLKVQVGAVGTHPPDPKTPGSKAVPNVAILRLAETGYAPKNVAPRFAISGSLSRHLKDIQTIAVSALRKHFSSKKGFDINKIGTAIGTAMSEAIKDGIRGEGLQPALEKDYLKKKLAKGYSKNPFYARGILLKSISFGVRK